MVEPRHMHRLQQTRQDRRQYEDQDAAPNSQLSDHSNLYQQDLDPPSSILFAEGSSVVTSSSTDLLSLDSQEWTSNECHDVVYSGNPFGALPFLEFDTSGQLDSLPLDSFRACLSNDEHSTDPMELSPNTSMMPAAPQQSCDCAKQVFETIRSLDRDPVSHITVHTLRLGTDLFDQLLACPRCYDVSKPPRVTLQNVLLVGRLSLEVTSGYLKYLKWLKDYCDCAAEENMGDTVYLIPGDVGSALGFSIRSDKFYDLIVQGLQCDAERLSELGRKFEARQRNRHLIGHRACPDSKGRCWKEKEDVDPDPSDVCPQSAAARALIPCYRVVDEVRSKVKQFEDAVA